MEKTDVCTLGRFAGAVRGVGLAAHGFEGGAVLDSPIRTVCAWCKGKETVIVDVPLDERGLSHGICKPCEKKWLEKREAA